MTSSLLLKCDTYASTLGRRPTPVAPSLVPWTPLPRRPISNNWRRDRFAQGPSRRVRVAIVKASSDTEAGVGTAMVKFQCFSRVEFGETMKISGGGNALGNWDLERSPSMTWGEGDIWTASIMLPPGTYELKCVKIRGDGAADWEPGSNRIVKVSEADVSQGLLTVDCRFLEAENTVVRSIDETDNFNDEAVRGPHESDPSLANGITLPGEISIEAVDSKGDGRSDAESWKRETESESEKKLRAEEKTEDVLDAAAPSMEVKNFFEKDEKKWEETEEADEEEEKKIKEDDPEPTTLDVKAEAELVVKETKRKSEERENQWGKENVDGKSKQEFQGKEEGEEETKAQTVNEDVSELVNPGDNETSNAASKDRGSSVPGAAAAGDWLAITLGLIAAPVVAWSEYTLKTSGCGLEPGPGGLLGALEGISYLTVVGLAGYFLYKRFADRSDPSGAVVLVETASYGTILAGLVVLALQFKEYGYIPSALPDDKCSAQPTPLPELKFDLKSNFKMDLKPMKSPFSDMSLPSLPSLPSIPDAPSLLQSGAKNSGATQASKVEDPPAPPPPPPPPAPTPPSLFSPPQPKTPTMKIEERIIIEDGMVCLPKNAAN